MKDYLIGLFVILILILFSYIFIGNKSIFTYLKLHKELNINKEIENTLNKKVGEVYVSLCHYKNKKFVQSMDNVLSPHKGTRESIRLASVNCALDLLLTICTSKTS